MSTFIPLEKRLNNIGLELIAGIDEVGRGPLAGPVVSAAVILKENAKIEGLKDSKLLTSQKRESLFETILKLAIDYSIVLVPHSTIDKINILNAVKLANYLCIEALTIKPDMVLIDGKDRQILDVPFKTIIKGDNLIQSIAAASILAKVTRDKLMARYSEAHQAYGFEQHMGYGTRKHISNIKEHGYCEIHRKSFKIKL